MHPPQRAHRFELQHIPAHRLAGDTEMLDNLLGADPVEGGEQRTDTVKAGLF
ncbi:Uncharacterised protein [Enterobacter hormaechei]|nr:Uncharacterised protein [Enterobacter hormaechei]